MKKIDLLKFQTFFKTVLLILSPSYIFLIILSILYQTIHLGMFGVKASLFFNIQDYLGISLVDVLSVILMGLLFWLFVKILNKICHYDIKGTIISMTIGIILATTISFLVPFSYDIRIVFIITALCFSAIVVMKQIKIISIFFKIFIPFVLILGTITFSCYFSLYQFERGFCRNYVFSLSENEIIEGCIITNSANFFLVFDHKTSEVIAIPSAKIDLIKRTKTDFKFNQTIQELFTQ